MISVSIAYEKYCRSISPVMTSYAKLGLGVSQTMSLSAESAWQDMVYV